MKIHEPFFLSLILVCLFFVPSVASAQVIDIFFPTEGDDLYFIDDFTQPRGGGRTHYATDIHIEKHARVFAAVDGEITFAPNPEPSYGFMLSLQGDDGYKYNYIHLNNDTPGTDDGMGGAEYAYAPGIRRGVRVVRGQHIGWAGDSGNAEWVGPHLHFEIYDGSTPINPYESLLAAYSQIGEPAELAIPVYDFEPEVERMRAATIGSDRGILETDEETLCEANSLIRTQDVSTVYYCGADGGRYAFQNEDTYFSWYESFDDVEYVSTEDMGNIPLRGVVTYRPGVYMVKLPSVPTVYAVGEEGMLRAIPSEKAAHDLYGHHWADMVKDLSEAFFPAYRLGEPVMVE